MVGLIINYLAGFYCACTVQDCAWIWGCAQWPWCGAFGCGERDLRAHRVMCFSGHFCCPYAIGWCKITADSWGGEDIFTDTKTCE